MTVVLPDTTATVLRRKEGGFDEHGERVRGGFEEPLVMLPARVSQRGDGGWEIGLDPGLWPVRQGDLVLDGQDRTFLVQASDLFVNNYRDDVDWVRVDALIRSVGGTTPGGVWFVGRYGVGPVEQPEGDIAGLFTGHGPPPPDLVAAMGDEYLDLDTGTLYELRASQ